MVGKKPVFKYIVRHSSDSLTSYGFFCGGLSVISLVVKLVNKVWVRYNDINLPKKKREFHVSIKIKIVFPENNTAFCKRSTT